MSNSHPILNKLITWIAISYLWAVILYLIGRQLVEGWHPIITLINCFIPFLFLPLLIIIPWAFWIRSKILLANILPLVGCFIYLYGYLLPISLIDVDMIKNIPSGSNVLQSMPSPPDMSTSWFAIVFSSKKTAKLCNPSNSLSDRRYVIG